MVASLGLFLSDNVSAEVTEGSPVLTSNAYKLKFCMTARVDFYESFPLHADISCQPHLMHMQTPLLEASKPSERYY